MFDKKSFCDRFCERLVAARKSAGMTQVQLGEMVGTKKQAVNNWEHGRNFPTLDVAANVADVLKVSLDYLTGRSDDPAGRD